MTFKPNFPVMIMGTTETYQTNFQGQDSRIMIGGNGLISALAVAKQVKCCLVSGIGGDIYHKIPSLNLTKKLNLDFLDISQTQTSFFYKSNLNKNGVETSGIPEFNYHQQFLEKSFKNLPDCKILHCSGTDPDFYLRNLEYIKYEILSVTTIGYFLEKKPQSVLKLMNLADVIFVNVSEFEKIKSKISLQKKLLVVTKGKDGLDIYFKNQKFSFENLEIKSENTLNAGDVMAGTFIANLIDLPFLGILDEKILARIVQKSCREVVKLLNQDLYYRIPFQINILEKIIQSTKQRILHKKRLLPQTELEKKLDLNNTSQQFKQTLSQVKSQKGVIAEIKKKSPSAGLISKEFEPIKTAKLYDKYDFVKVISVITEPNFFGGNLKIMQNIKKQTTKPILRKDFIIDQYQILESKYYGADLVLLIATILTQETLKSFIEKAKSIGLVALVEINNEQEKIMAIKAGAELLGINSRNLEDFSIDINSFERLSKDIPKHIIKIAESGVKNPEDIFQYHSLGAELVLIGTYFMQNKNLIELLNTIQTAYDSNDHI